MPAPCASETHTPFPGLSRRGSNVSLTLDMCTPGCNEEGFGYLMSPREESAREYLLSASRVLQAEELHEKALDPFLLQAEFFVSSLEPAAPLCADPCQPSTYPGGGAWCLELGICRRLVPLYLQLSHRLGQAAFPLSFSFLIWKMGMKIIGLLKG